MQPRKRILVPHGMAHVATEPVVLSTAVVGREFAVALFAEAGTRAGGLINLLVSQHVVPVPDGDATPQRLLRFLRDVKAAAGQARTTAVIAGGGDALAMMSAANWLAWSRRMTELLTHAILDAGITVTRTEIGGRHSRRVTLDLVDSTVGVEPFGRDAVAARPEPDLPSPAAERDAHDYSVDIGAARVDHSPNRLVAILGSCVGIALYDPTTRIGGLAHAAMPKHPDGSSDPMRYADTAVPALLAQMQSLGADKSKVVAKIAGGAHSLPPGPSVSLFRIPGDNIRRAREALARAEVPLIAEHVGGRNGRKIVVDLRTFRVSVAWLDGGDATVAGGGG